MVAWTVQPAPPSRQPCQVHFGVGLEGDLSAWLMAHGAPHRAVVIADGTVAALHAAGWSAALSQAGVENDILTFPAGEGSKTRAVKAQLEDRMLDLGLGRDAMVVALGGGVTLDLAGFVAATYMRGLPWLALPTTTLAMVDSALGGKTGVDTPAGKNLVGAFHPPVAIFADTKHLATLPLDSFREGFAEAIKHGLIASTEHFESLEASVEDLLARREPALSGLLSDSAAIKARFVEADETEQDARRALNFGHTFAHALERLSGWRLSHGQAVARGLLAECRLSRRLGLLSPADESRAQQLLSRFGFPPDPFHGLPDELTPYPTGRLQAADYLAATRSDKKARAGRVEYVLLDGVGSVARAEAGRGGWSRPVADETVAAAFFDPSDSA